MKQHQLSVWLWSYITPSPYTCNSNQPLHPPPTHTHTRMLPTKHAGIGDSKAAAAAAASGAGSSSRQGSVRPLLLVSPGWIVDSVLDLQQQLQQQHSRRLAHLHSLTQQQQQHQQSFTQEQLLSFTQLPLSQGLGAGGSFDSQIGFDLPEFELRQQRRNEATYAVQVQQQQMGGGGAEGLPAFDGERADHPPAAAAATEATAGGGGLSVEVWPWEAVGLKTRQAGSSSGDSSDGEALFPCRLLPLLLLLMFVFIWVGVMPWQGVFEGSHVRWREGAA